MGMLPDILPGRQSKSESDRKPPGSLTPVAVLLILVVGFAVYSPSLNGQFLMDDHVLIVDNPMIKSPANIPGLFGRDVGAGSGFPFPYYRPLQMLSYSFDYYFWQLNARAYHAVNIFIHLLTALSLFWLARLLTGHRLLPLGAALLFLVHPVQVETVAYISDRGDCLVGLFVLLTTACYVTYLQSNRRSFYALALLFLVAALFSKENGLMLPGLLVLCHVYYRKSFKSFALIGAIMVFLVFLIWYLSVMGNVAGDIRILTFLKRIPGIFAAIGGYIRILFFPFHLHMGHDFRLFAITEPAVITGMVVTAMMIFSAVMSIRRHRLVFFAISWFFITLLPVSNFIPTSFYMADHFIYLPSAGFSLVAAYLFRNLYHRANRHRMTAAGAFAAVILFYAVLGVRQQDYWLTEKGFCERTLRYVPDNARMLNGLGVMCSLEGDYDRAVRLYDRAIRLKPNMYMAYYNLGLTYYGTGRFDKAAEAFRRALELSPRFTNACNMLGVVYCETGGWEKAESAFEQAIAAGPVNTAPPVTNLGVLYFQRGDYDRAVELFEQAIRIDPGYALAYQNLGFLYRQSGEWEKAERFLKKAAALQQHKVHER